MGLTASDIKTLAPVFYYAPLILLAGASYPSAIEPAQLEALSLAFIEINNQAAAIAIIFFGFEALLRGWLLDVTPQKVIVYEIYVNGVLENTAIGTTQTSAYGQLGDNVITVIAIDEAGNRSTAGTTTLFISF
jgi:hypothetical protein